MPTIGIYVSDELKAKMDKCPEVNWSAVCQKAIETYLTNHRVRLGWSFKIEIPKESEKETKQ